MLKIVMFCLGLLALGLPSEGQAQSADAAAIENVITGQLEAFNNGDVDTAWTFASPMIKGMFGNAANFGLMVQNGYPMVWSNSDVQFLDLAEINDQVFQRLTLRDADGVRYALEYAMIKTEQGWQINGVSVVPMPDVSA